MFSRLNFGLLVAFGMCAVIWVGIIYIVGVSL